MWKSGTNFLVSMIDVYSVDTKGLLGFYTVQRFCFLNGFFCGILAGVPVDVFWFICGRDALPVR